MDDLFSIIGSIASVGSIPLAIYLYMKTKEAFIEKIRREIVRILSYQIGENRELTIFELETVINSKLREGKVKSGAILESEIVEDLVAETISNPLIDDKRKEPILQNLKKLYYKGNLYEMVDNFDIGDIDDETNSVQTMGKVIREIITENEEVEKELSRLTELKSKYQRGGITGPFAVISSIMSIVLALSILTSETNLDGILGPLSKIFTSNSVLNSVIGGSFTSIFAGLSIVVLQFIRTKSSK